MVEWPEESRLKRGHIVRATLKVQNVSQRFLSDVEANEAFRPLVQAILDAFQARSEPRREIAELSGSIDKEGAFGGHDETTRQIVLALACVAALRKNLTKGMWEYLWSLAWHSAALEIFLPQAVVVAAEDTEFQSRFIDVAHDVIDEAIKNPGRRAVQNQKGFAANLRDHWKKDHRLSELWRGSAGRHFDSAGRDDDGILSIVSEIDVGAFVQLLALYDYPDPVTYALMWCGAHWRFEKWRELMAVAPEAFDDSGRWNGSLILPLLLSLARAQFQFHAGPRSTPEDIVEMTAGIKELAAEVGKVVAARKDAFGCFDRWGSWLIHQVVRAVSTNRIPYPADAASHGFTEDALLDALISKMPAGRVDAGLSPDTEVWEPWCHLALGTLAAAGGKGTMPSSTNFINDWRISADNWSTKSGQQLKQRAAPFEGMPPKADAYGARILALSMVVLDSPAEEWAKFWRATTLLREIVEFGDPDDDVNDGWDGRMSAARLLMFQFSIGLMMMEHLIRPPQSLNLDRRKAIEALLPLLDEAIRDMMAIDQLNAQFWSEAIRHLAIRRAKWLIDPTISGDLLFGDELKPGLADFIDTLAGDTEGLLSLAYTTLLNGVDGHTLAAAFIAAGVDLKEEINIADRLIELSPRAIGLDKMQIDGMRQILNLSRIHAG